MAGVLRILNFKFLQGNSKWSHIIFKIFNYLLKNIFINNLFLRVFKKYKS